MESSVTVATGALLGIAAAFWGILFVALVGGALILGGLRNQVKTNTLGITANARGIANIHTLITNHLGMKELE
jgi:hypothetical protein